MIQPDELKKDERLLWSSGTGRDVWQMFCAAASGDVKKLDDLVQRDSSLVRCQYSYCTPLDFAVRENQVEAAAYLLDRGVNSIGLSFKDNLVEIARERGYTEMQALLEGKLASIHNASPAGEPLAAAIRDRDLAKVRSCSTPRQSF